MPRIYFFVNALLYLALAILCSVRHVQSARGTGYVELNASGHSEYLVIYGGLQLGLGLFYLYLTRDSSFQRLGLVFSLLLYAPIITYRIVTLLLYRPTSPVTLGTAALELSLLVWGLIAWKNLPA